jgi:hypothetical protein
MTHVFMCAHGHREERPDDFQKAVPKLNCKKCGAQMFIGVGQHGHPILNREVLKK